MPSATDRRWGWTNGDALLPLPADAAKVESNWLAAWLTGSTGCRGSVTDRPRRSAGSMMRIPGSERIRLFEPWPSRDGVLSPDGHLRQYKR